MADGADRAELILQMTDAVSPVANKIAASLDKTNVAMGGSDKAVNKLEKSFGSFIGVLNDVAKSAGVTIKQTQQLGASASAAAAKTNASYRSMAAAATQYQAAADSAAAAQGRLGASKVNSGGRLIASSGQFISNAEAAEAANASNTIARSERAIQAIEQQRVRTLTELNGLTGIQKTAYVELSSATGQSTASLRANLTAQQAVTEAQRRGILTAEQAARSSALNAARPVGGTVSTPTAAVPVPSGGSSAGIRAVGNEAEASASKVGRFTSALNAMSSATPATRYALYSVSQSLTRLGIGLLAIPVASALVAASFDRDFANVARATVSASGKSEVNLKSLRATLISMSEQLPVSFKDLTAIATQGAQLGVTGTKGLATFTKTVAELSATTNLSADAAGTLLGRFNAVGAANAGTFDKIASSVLNVGVNSAATESQIAAIATQIVGIGKVAGFTSPQIIGLSGAIASVSSNGAALARGAITRFITVLQSAVESGGPALEAFANTAHVSATQVQKDWGTDKFAGDFQKFFKGLSKQGNEANQTLIAMGITSVRDIPLFLNLANGWKTLNRAMSDAQQGYNNTNILAVHYSVINDTLVSKVKELGNTFAAAFDKIGHSSTGALTGAVDVLTAIVNAISGVLDTNLGSGIVTVLAGLAVALGSVALFGSGVAKVSAGIAAMGYALDKVKLALAAYDVAAAGGVAANEGLAASYGVTARGARLASLAINGMIVGLAAGIAVGATAWLSDLTNSIGGNVASYKELTKAYDKGGIAALNANKAFRETQNSLGTDVTLDKMNDGLYRLGKNFEIADQGGNKWLHDLTGIGDNSWSNIKNLDAVMANLVSSGHADQAAKIFQQVKKGWEDGDALLPGFKGNIGELYKQFSKYSDAVAKSAAATKKENDALAVLGVTSGNSISFMQQLSSATGMSAKNITDFEKGYTKSVQSLTDFNSVVGQVQAALQASAQAQADAAGGNAKATDYYDGTSVSLQQMTDQYNANNSAQQQWSANLITLASSYGQDAALPFIQAGYSAVNNSILQQLVNATPAQAQAYIAAQQQAATLAAQATGEAILSSPFLSDGMGNPVSAATANAFIEGIKAGVPVETLMADLNLRFNANPTKPKTDTGDAQKALNDFVTHNMGFDIRGQAHLDTSPAQYAADMFINANNGRRITIYQDLKTGNVQNFGTFAGGNTVGYTGGYFAGGNSTKFQYDTGGYTGPGAKYSPAGIVHRGEFVFNKEATNAYGVPYLMNMMRSFRSSRGRGYSGGGPVGAIAAQQGVPTVALDAGTLMALASMQNVTLYLDGKQLTASNNANNVQASNRREA